MVSTMHLGMIGVSILAQPFDAAMLRGTKNLRNDRPKSRVRQATATTFVQSKGLLTALDPSTFLLFNETITKNDNATAPSLLDGASFIVGGSTAFPNDATFFSLILTYDKSRSIWKNHGCGGALISDRHILTAADRKSVV